MNFSMKSCLQTAAMCAILLSAAAAMTALPFDNLANANNGGGNAGGNGGGNGGGNAGGNGGGNAGGNGGGNAGGNGGGNAGGNGSGNAGGNGVGNAAGQSGEAHGQQDIAADGTDDGATDLGKLNGFMNAAPTALDNASPNSAIGTVSKTFRDLLNDYAAQQNTGEPSEGEEGDDPVDIDDLAEALAGAANKPVSPDTIDGILGKLSDTFGDDYSGLDGPTDGDDGDGTGETTDGGETDGEAEGSFAEALADRVNEINGYGDQTDDES